MSDAGESPERDGAIELIGQLAFETMGALTRIAGENELSLTQLRVIAILRDRRLRMLELAGYLGLEKSTMTGLITRAEKRGLVTRAPDAEDGRAVDVFLTDEGRRLVDSRFLEFERALAPFVSRLDESEQTTLRGLLERMLDRPSL